MPPRYTALPSVGVITLVSLVAHLALALAVPLVQDEAYYALWASVPSAGYYDHPPMVAWWIAAGTALAGETLLGLRGLSVIAMALLGALAADMLRAAGQGETQARLAALFTNTALLVVVLGFVATPDAPSAFFWALAVAALIRADQAPNRSGWAWWLVLGVAVGAGMLSKFTNLFLAVGLVGWLVATVSGRAWLMRPQPWVAAAIAMAVVMPYLLWNWRLDWLGFERQLGRVRTEAWALDHLAGYGVTLVLVMSPVIFWAALRGVGRAHSALIWTSAPVLTYFLWHATHSSVGANWLLPVCAPLAAVAAGYAATWSRRLIWMGAGFGPVLMLILLPFVVVPQWHMGTGDTPPNQTKGWAALVPDIRAEMAAQGAEWIVTDHYGLAGLLHHHLGDVVIRDLAEPSRYTFLAPLDAGLCVAPGLMILRGRTPDGLGTFADLSPRADLVRQAGQSPLARYTVYGFTAKIDCAAQEPATLTNN
jgi:4-amino-4-deoxy-L-arabinose transferase-like glycosyltransferase